MKYANLIYIYAVIWNGKLSFYNQKLVNTAQATDSLSVQNKNNILTQISI